MKNVLKSCRHFFKHHRVEMAYFYLIYFSSLIPTFYAFRLLKERDPSPAFYILTLMSVHLPTALFVEHSYRVSFGFKTSKQIAAVVYICMLTPMLILENNIYHFYNDTFSYVLGCLFIAGVVYGFYHDSKGMGCQCGRDKAA